MSYITPHKGMTVLPVIFALLFAVALLLILQQQQQGVSEQQGALVVSKRAELLADAAGQWVAMEILSQQAPNTPTSCPADLSFADTEQPQLNVTIDCSIRRFNNNRHQLVDLEITVEYSTPSSPAYIRQQFEWVLSP